MAVTLVEKWEPRELMLSSIAGQFLCFSVITILLQFAEIGGETGSRLESASNAFFFPL
ncbi:uncharacterized protein BDW70DRAFT_136275 [Aspergillus foveolatus]|uniref:uncharacterized protein n=1 Tax=Aspergillus foveolatus TaxID=210207 RepID=UPI003CCC988D